MTCAGLQLLPLLVSGHSTANREADFSGFYTAVLWSGTYIVSVAVFRAFDTTLAEIPFLATRPQSQVPNAVSWAVKLSHGMDSEGASSPTCGEDCQWMSASLVIRKLSFFRELSFGVFAQAQRMLWLQGLGFGRLLLTQIEDTLAQAGVAAATMPAWVTVRISNNCCRLPDALCSWPVPASAILRCGSRCLPTSLSAAVVLSDTCPY